MTKYFVASRRIISKILALPEYPIILDLLAVNTMMENAEKSVFYDARIHRTGGASGSPSQILMTVVV